MKNSVYSRVEEFNAELEKFAARWNQFKPKPELVESGEKEACKKAVETIKEKKQEFEELDKTRASLM